MHLRASSFTSLPPLTLGSDEKALRNVKYRWIIRKFAIINRVYVCDCDFLTVEKASAITLVESISRRKKLITRFIAGISYINSINI